MLLGGPGLGRVPLRMLVVNESDTNEYGSMEMSFHFQQVVLVEFEGT